MIIPTIPHKPPNKRIENSTQNADSPVDSPRIAGPIIFPSICCNMAIKITKYNACIGFTIKIKNTLGISPRYGPNTGIIFVTPIITLINNAYGRPITVIATKHKIPTIVESTIFPIIKPLNMPCDILTYRITVSACSFLNMP